MEFFEGADESLRIVAGGVGVLDGEKVGLVLGIAVKLFDGQRAGEAANIFDSHTGGTGDHGHGTNNVGHVAAGEGASGVAGGDVSGLMGHDGGQFGFTLRGGGKRAGSLEE